MKRAEMVVAATEELVDAENAVGAALAKVARFAGSLEDMRIQSKLSAVIGQAALVEVFKAATLLTEARGAMVMAHGHLDDVKTRIGCRTVAGSNGTDKGDHDTPTGPKMPTGSLKRVA